MRKKNKKQNKKTNYILQREAYVSEGRSIVERFVECWIFVSYANIVSLSFHVYLHTLKGLVYLNEYSIERTRFPYPRKLYE